MRLERVSPWLLMVGAACLAALLTLTIDRTLLRARQPAATPPPIAATAQPVTLAVPRAPVAVVIEPPPPTPPPAPLASDTRDRLLRDLQQNGNTQRSGMLVLNAERQVALATNALLANDAAQTDLELVAATASLDEALRYAPDPLKPPLANERLTIGRVRADLTTDPRDLDQELLRMSDRLLALVTAGAQE